MVSSKCPRCGSSSHYQSVSNIAARTVSGTVGMMAAFTASTFVKSVTNGYGRISSKNIMNAIQDVVDKQYTCKNCGHTFVVKGNN